MRAIRKQNIFSFNVGISKRKLVTVKQNNLTLKEFSCKNYHFTNLNMTD